MSRPRDRQSTAGLLPRMEARPRTKGGYTYRYHPVGGKPIPLGRDREAALRQVLDLTGHNGDKGTVNELWRLYQLSPGWQDLAQGTRDDYTQASKPLLKRFGAMAPQHVKPAHIARYLRVERAKATVRANREFALLSNLLNLAVERGELDTNPCKQVRRNKEKPRKKAPAPATLQTFLEWAWKQKGQGAILAGMAEFASLAGNRGIEFRTLAWPLVGDLITTLIRAKQRDGQPEIVEEVEMSDLLVDLMKRMRALGRNTEAGWVFPNAKGNAYTAQAFKLGFARLKAKAREEGALTKELNFTFHDLRHFYVTQYKKRHGELPELHANPNTTQRIYEDSLTVQRKSL